MHVPDAISRQFSGSGGLLVAGSTVLSLVLAGIALGWLGIAVVVGVLFLLVVIEVWREAASLVAKLSDSEKRYGVASREADAVPGLRTQVHELQATINALKEELHQPRATPEQALEAVGIHLARIELVLKHRSMSERIADIPVTRAVFTESGTAELLGFSTEPLELIGGEALAVVSAAERSAWGVSDPVQVEGSQVRAGFTLSVLPVELAADIEQRGSFTPQGYMMRLAGLCFAEYEGLSDKDLTETLKALKAAADALANALIKPSQAASDDPSNDSSGSGE